MDTNLKNAIEQVFLDTIKEMDTCQPAEFYPHLEAQKIMVKILQDKVRNLIYQDNENLSH